MLNLEMMRGKAKFDEFKAKIEAAGSDQKDFFGGTYTGGYCIQQNPDEFAALLTYLWHNHLMGMPPLGVYGEIGSAAGGTLRMIREEVGFDKGIVIDNGVHPNHKHFADNTKSMLLGTFIGDSHSKEAADFLKANMPDQFFDVIVIDGDHSAEGVIQDIRLVLPYCNEATLIVLHDIVACEGVKAAWAMFDTKVAEFISEDKPFGIGVAHG